MQLIILASGRGSRLGDLTIKKPKCLVNVNNKSIIDYQREIFKYFKTIIIIVGYKGHLIKKKLKNLKNIIFIENKHYRQTNMVYSLCLARKYFNNDTIITYSDIIFDKNIIKNIYKKKNNILPINKEWKDLWLKRMKKKDIYNDAEDLQIKYNQISQIGTKIQGTLPKYQYMGIIKLNKSSLIKFFNIFKAYNKPKISFTDFLNYLIKKYKFNIEAYKNSKYWYEIDNETDLKFTEKQLKTIYKNRT